MLYVFIVSSLSCNAVSLYKVLCSLCLPDIKSNLSLHELNEI